jgi:hypothetical protein
MKIWLDDERVAPEDWTRTRSADEAIELLEENKVEEISLDYDLFDGEPTGGKVAKWLLKAAKSNRWGQVPYIIRCHSMNYDGVCEIAWDLAEIEWLRWGLKK